MLLAHASWSEAEILFCGHDRKKDWSSGTRGAFHTPVFGAKRQKCAKIPI
jgi:hypothetical protein